MYFFLPPEDINIPYELLNDVPLKATASRSSKTTAPEEFMCLEIRMPRWL
jgi:hypothetical protein